MNLALFPQAAHTAESSEWYTPPPFVESGRRYLGGRIDLDPASCDAAQRIVKAERHFTEQNDGLRQSWSGAATIWLNPPSPPAEWWDVLIRTIVARRLSVATGRDRRPLIRAVFVAYSVQFLQGSQSQDRGARRRRGPETVPAWSVCVPWKRVPYLTTPAARIRTLTAKAAQLDDDGKPRWSKKQLAAMQSEVFRLQKLPPDDFIDGPSPPGASAFVGIGGTVTEFEMAFQEHGECSHGRMVER